MCVVKEKTMSCLPKIHHLHLTSFFTFLMQLIMVSFHEKERSHSIHTWTLSSQNTRSVWVLSYNILLLFSFQKNDPSYLGYSHFCWYGQIYWGHSFFRMDWIVSPRIVILLRINTILGKRVVVSSFLIKFDWKPWQAVILFQWCLQL